MPVTTELLSRLRSLDDLVEVASALRFAARIEELPSVARRRLGLPESVSRAAIVGKHAQLTLYGLQHRGGRTEVTQAVESLGRHTRSAPFIVMALSAREPSLTIACPSFAETGPPVRQLCIALDKPSPVAAEIISGLAPGPGESPRSLLARAGDVLRQEGLTNRFFREMARLHQIAASELRHMPRATRDDRSDLALVMLTRVLFIYFVQAKGWLAGRSDFLPSLLDIALRSGHLFHHAVYEPLCFGALSTPLGEREGTARALGDVPFLNGGLFERHALERRFPLAMLPNDAWRQLIDDLFERFHFTLREGDDSDSVDPEMLGRVFEGLMARDRRRASGTYFTPRDMLSELVRESLDAALKGRAPHDVARLRILDPAVGSGAFLLEALRQIEERHAGAVPGHSAAARRAIVRDCLFGVDVDPMAVRLAELRLWLALVVDDDATWDAVTPLPNLDRNLRQGDSLVSPLDVSRKAGQPAGARFLAVAEQRAEYFAATGSRKHELSRRLRDEERRLAHQAAASEIRSLTARLEDVVSQGRDLFGQRAGRRKRQQVLVDAWRARRRELKGVQRRIDENDALPFFAYDVHFADIANPGFDIVMGNPPWVRGERLTVASRSALSARYSTFRPASGNGGFAHLPDLSVAFVERALELARPDGVIALILPAKLLRAGYAGPLRSHLRRRATILRLDDRSHSTEAGFAATVFPLVCLMRNAPSPAGAVTAVRTTSGQRQLAGSSLARELPLQQDDARSIWLPIPLRTVTALRAVLATGRTLGTVFHPRLGVKTGANDVFLRGSAAELPAYQAPAVHGRDVSPFAVRPSSWMLAALDSHGSPLREVPRTVADWLAPHRRSLDRRADAAGARPWALFRTELLRHRWIVVWRDIAPRLEAAVIDRTISDAPIPLNTCYGVGLDDELSALWLVAWLNSTLIRRTAELLAERASGGCYRFSAATVGALPVPAHGAPELSALARIGETAITRKVWDHDELDRIVRGALRLPAGFAAELSGSGDALR